MKHLYDHLKTGNCTAIESLFADGPIDIDDQQAGKVADAELKTWVSDTASWLEDLQATIWPVTEIETPQRTALEFEAWITTGDGRVDLPIIAVADRNASGAIQTLRTYHSTWPWTANHQHRPPILNDTKPVGPASINDYVDAINTGDAHRALALFAQHGYMQEASGARFRHQGSEALSKLYGHLAPGTDGPQIRPRRVTTNGRDSIVEYDFATARETVAGAATFQLNPTGHIAAIRVSDDAAL